MLTKKGVSYICNSHLFYYVIMLCLYGNYLFFSISAIFIARTFNAVSYTHLISTAEEFYKKKLTGLGKSLEDYDMLIIGFASEYYDLYNSSNRKSQYAVDAINLFIDSGKSVLFSNDTTSFVNVSPHHSFKDGHLTSFSDDWKVPRQWGYYMNLSLIHI